MLFKLVKKVKVMKKTYKIILIIFLIFIISFFKGNKVFAVDENKVIQNGIYEIEINESSKKVLDIYQKANSSRENKGAILFYMIILMNFKNTIY